MSREGDITVDRAQYEHHKANYATHTVMPANHCPELCVCSVCGAGESELEYYSCIEYKDQMKSQLIYLASPYSDSDPAIRQYRFEIICRVAARLMKQERMIFCPIAHTHPIAVAGQLPTGFDFWERYDKLMMDACAEIWVVTLDGWKESIGVGKEIAYMKSQDKLVRYIDALPDELKPYYKYTANLSLL